MKKTLCLLLTCLLISVLAVVFTPVTPFSNEAASISVLKNPTGGPKPSQTVRWRFEVINPERTAAPGEWVQWQYRVTNSPDSTDVLTLEYLTTYIPNGLARPKNLRGFSWSNAEFPPAPLKPGQSFEGNHVAWRVALIKPGETIEADLGAGAVAPADPLELLAPAKINVQQ
jgi:hypothetical protein